MSDVLLSIEKLKKYFPVKNGLFRKKKFVQAVESVSFDIYRGETLGLVGESGCGKTTLGRTMIRLYEPTSGRIRSPWTCCPTGGKCRSSSRTPRPRWTRA